MPAITQTARVTPSPPNYILNTRLRSKAGKANLLNHPSKFPRFSSSDPRDIPQYQMTRTPTARQIGCAAVNMPERFGMFILKVYHKGIRVFLSEHAAEL